MEGINLSSETNYNVIVILNFPINFQRISGWGILGIKRMLRVLIQLGKDIIL